MEFIPYQKITIRTDLSREEVLNRFRQRVGKVRRENFLRIDKNIFSGQIVENSFKLQLITDYRNSFTPEIHGVISEGSNYTEVTAVLKSNIPVVVCTAVVTIIGLIWLIIELIEFKNISDFDWLALLFLFFPYGLCWFGFNQDADLSIDGLLKITKGKLSNPR